MPISAADRKAMQAVPLMGSRMVDYLEMIGTGSFAELATAEAITLRMRINTHLGRPHINAMGERALANLIEAAKQQTCRDRMQGSK